MKKVFVILTAVLVVGLIVAGFFIFRRLSFFKKPRHFQLTTATIVPGSKKNKKITKDGGKIILVTENGVKVILIIPPGAKEIETEISLAALSKPPVENYQTDPQDPGVIIEPIDLKLKIPATLIFDFNPQNDVVGITSEAPSEEAMATPVTLPQEEEKLTEAEQTRRERATPYQISERSGVLYTDSSESEAGTNIYFIPSRRNVAEGQVETQITNGGTISFDNQITAPEAKEQIENVLNNPNATYDQILEAAAAAQAWGFEGLSERAKTRLKEKIKESTQDLAQKCQQGKVSKTKILKWQALAQALGFEAEEEELNKLTNQCRGYYSLMMETSNLGPRTITYRASVCGFIDDQWQGTYTDIYQGSSSSWNLTGQVSFSLPAEGGTFIIPTAFGGTMCIPEKCWSESFGPFSVPFTFDGVDTVTSDYFSGKINFQKNCGTM